MNLTDFYFLVAFAAVLIVYYLVPRKCQWGVILVSSIAYYLVSGHPVLAVYPVAGIVVTYVCTRINNKKSLIAGVAALLTILIVLKYLKFIWGGAYPEAGDSSVSLATFLMVPLGLSYYTFTLIGYMVDVYNGIAEPQTNLLKLMAFGMYAPALVSGPIMMYRDISGGFYAEHRFDYVQVTRGLQRMLWGFFKKLVIAERLGVMVATVYDDPATYGGVYVWIGILCFTIQLYSDFSGLMDIVLGISQCLGITLPENFNTPFFATSVAEYWRRWHITLGVWFKEYLFYPILRTKAYTKLQDRIKTGMLRKYKPEKQPVNPDAAEAGPQAATASAEPSIPKDVLKSAKKRSKQISTYIAMFVLWLIIGLWHGGNFTYVIGSGLLHWFYIVMEEVLEPPFKKLWEKLGVNPAGRALTGLRMLRTFIFVNIGNAFFRAASVGSAIRLLGCGFSRPYEGVVGVFRGLALALASDGVRGLKAIGPLGLSYMDMLIVLISIVILFVVDILKTRTDVREMIAARPVVLRYLIWFALLFYVIILGQYGPGYDAAAFIYQGF